MLTILDRLPDGLLDGEARDLHRILPGPTLLHLPGLRTAPLFVSVLLHGNETTGLTAIQGLLRKYDEHKLPRALSVFFGNVSAAAQSRRRLDGQPDYNRVWPCADSADGQPEHRMMRQVVDEMRTRNVFASIDIHNNTGLNPHYGCINCLEPRFFHLATLFSRTVVYFTRPTGVQSLAFAELCPAITVECGKPEQPFGADHARDFIDTCLHLDVLPDTPLDAHAMNLFHTVATLTLRNEASAGFAADDQPGHWDITFPPDLDRLNFRELPAGTSIGRLHTDHDPLPLQVVDETGIDVSEHYLYAEDGRLRITRAVMPSMFTLDLGIIRQDCMGYLMERL
ncbi:MAG TPA: peptidase M14 [Gammaproteobacteria bacterium]|nr:peptidase M14 [Gammaproteobacteria bacterium]